MLEQGYLKELKLPKTDCKYLLGGRDYSSQTRSDHSSKPEIVTRNILCWLQEQQGRHCGLEHKRIAILLSLKAQAELGDHFENGNG